MSAYFLQEFSNAMAIVSTYNFKLYFFFLNVHSRPTSIIFYILCFTQAFYSTCDMPTSGEKNDQTT